MADGLGLGDNYGETPARVKRQDGEKARLGIAVLMRVSHSKRPLKPDELSHPSSRNKVAEAQFRQCSFDRDIASLLSRARCFRLGGFHCPVNPLYLHEYFRAHPELFSKAHSTGQKPA